MKIRMENGIDTSHQLNLCEARIEVTRISGGGSQTKSCGTLSGYSLQRIHSKCLVHAGTVREEGGKKGLKDQTKVKGVVALKKRKRLGSMFLGGVVVKLTPCLGG